MKTVKIMVAALLIAASLSATAIAQNKQKTDSKNTAAPALKEHKCNSKCTAGAHNYLHGEKGHVCTAACKKAATKKA